MKKLIKIALTLLLLVVTALCVTACNSCGGGGGDGGEDNGQIQTGDVEVPGSVVVNPLGVVSWKRPSGVQWFDIEINGTVIDGYFKTSYDLLAGSDLPEDGVFNVRVLSVQNNEKSAWSDYVKFIYRSNTPLAAPKLGYSSGKLTWEAQPKAVKVIVVTESGKTELEGSATEYNLSSVKKSGTVSVQFVGDGIYFKDSAASKVEYDSAKGTVSLASPANVRMVGYVLRFDEVYGATSYFIKDVNNVVTELTEPRSDRTTKTLIKSVWASVSGSNVQDSAPAEVTYYANGTGTESDPFLITKPEELRFVEYYESVNLSKHYKFTKDIPLPIYAPGSDERYNNFYNLGSLSGVIDGDGHKLSNLVIYYNDGYCSLFDSIASSGAVKNLVINNANLRTWTNRTNDGVMHEKGGECAPLAYVNRGKISNVTVTGSKIYAEKDGASALVSVNKGVIEGCTVQAGVTVYGNNEAGGIAVFNSGTITGCKNGGSVSGKTTVGGVAGRNNGVITKCGNEGKITATTYGGGIVGYNFNIYDEGLQYRSTVSECYNYGTITVTSYGGGIAGKNGSDGVNEVGSMSYANAAIFSSYNRGAIKGAASLGGIVGDNYGYHDADGDLGVVNCYNSGEFSIDTSALKGTRLYLSLADCPWGSDGGALIYVHYWSEYGESTWPGVKMIPTTIGTKQYYYADMSVKAEQLDGVKFSRVNPASGEIWGDPSEDITGSFTTGNLLFYIDSNWKTASTASSAALVSNTPPSVGGVAGFSNMINDCYFVAAKVNLRTLAAGVSTGTQYNKIKINGATADSKACEIAPSALATFAATLNAYANLWVDSDRGPILKWQNK